MRSAATKDPAEAQTEDKTMNRGRLFAQIEHIERVHSHGLSRPQRAPSTPAAGPSSPPAPAPRLTPKARAEQLFRPRPASEQTLTASPAAIATAAKRAKSTRPPTVVMPPAHDPAVAVRLNAKALKVTLVLDAAMVAMIELKNGAPAPPFVIDVGDRKERAQVSAKELRKVLATIAEQGADQVAVILQGKLVAGDVLAEAGLVAQVKTPKGPPPE
jgi:hypothetical protein